MRERTVPQLEGAEFLRWEARQPDKHELHLGVVRAWNGEWSEATTIVPELEGDEYLSWEARQPDRHELHQGFAVALASETFDHSRIASNLCAALRRADPAPCAVFGTGFKIAITPSTFYYPDAAAVREREPPGALFTSDPVVVVEVAAQATRAYDLIDKRASYRTLRSLEAYIVVDSQRRRVEVDTRSFDRWRTEIAGRDGLTLGDTTIALEEIYASTPLE